MSGSSIAHRVLINREYAPLFAGQTISVLGDEVFMVALALWIATSLGRGQSWAPVAMSGVLLAASVPIVVLGTVAGVYVDRWDKRSTMLTMDLLRAVLVLSILPAAALSLPPAARLAAVYAAVFLTTVCSQFFLPSRTVLVGDVVTEEERPHASGLAQISMSASIIIGPPLGAILLAHLGFGSVLVVDGLSFLVSFLSILAVRPPRAPQQDDAVAPRAGFARELAEGVRIFRRSRVLMVLLVNGIVIMLGAGALNALDVFFAVRNLHANQTMYGVISGGLGLGALTGAVALSAFAQRIGLVRLFCWSLTGLGASFVVYSRLTSFAPALVVLFLAGIVMAGVNVAVMPLVLRETPRELLGRVSAVLNQVMQTANVVSVVVAGALVSTVLGDFHAKALGMAFGPVDTIFTVAGLLAILGGIYSAVSLRGRSAARAESAEAVA